MDAREQAFLHSTGMTYAQEREHVRTCPICSALERIGEEIRSARRREQRRAARRRR